MSIHFPNIRRLFKPDPGYIIADVDLSGADAQVVAWEAEDDDLKSAFRQGLDVHDHNGRAVWRDSYNRDAKPRKYTMRDELKRAVHGTNYVAGVKTLATTLGWSWPQVRDFQSTWFRLHPGIGGPSNPDSWHRRIERQLQLTRRVSNRFGYGISYFDRPDNLLPKALAWIPQSTVAVVASRGAVQLRKSVPWVRILLQVHDSVVFQLPFHRATPSGFQEIQRALRVVVPYPDPLEIPWGLAFSETSWGEVKKKKWTEVT